MLFFKTTFYGYRWYPPGHGDFYESFYNSGLLKKFIDEVAFVVS
jgi:UDP-N-acetylglucosamine pyrophosphorylase